MRVWWGVWKGGREERWERGEVELWGVEGWGVENSWEK